MAFGLTRNYFSSISRRQHMSKNHGETHREWSAITILLRVDSFIVAFHFVGANSSPNIETRPDESKVKNVPKIICSLY
jgi:hypothetical protein